MVKHPLPDFLTGSAITQQKYGRWLNAKAAAHFRRDRKYGNKAASIATYKSIIHEAVCASDAKDAYTGEKLDWALLSKWNNDEAARGKRGYKARFALLPTVDHVGDRAESASFRICALRTNDAKGDMSMDEFVSLCHRVIAHQEKS